MLNLSVGQKKNPLAVEQLITLLSEADLNGMLFIGYPVLTDLDNKIVIDALLICKEHGLIVIDFDDRTAEQINFEPIRQKQDDLYRILEIKLKGYKSLMNGRELAFPVKIVTLVPEIHEIIQEEDLLISGLDNFLELITCFDPIDNNLLKDINAAIERVTNVRPPRKRSNIKKDDSRGAILKTIEKEVYNLDKWQNNAAIETPDGVQRIRGLAGSGKTIVLALKAAYLYAIHEDWTIAITFQTRSLYQQFEELVRRFTWDQIHDEPDWNRLRIIHAWGGVSQPGFYSEVAKAQGITPKNFNYGKQLTSTAFAFDAVCSELITEINEDAFEPIFDVILVDEAQDFPGSFFRLAYLAAKKPKRIIYAYDELQNLSNFTMLYPSELFGSDKEGNPHVSQLRNIKGNPSQDIVLPVCYRNTPWALAIAHALGFGIYHDGGLIQYFNDPKGLWEEVGYELVAGQFLSGNIVNLKRRPGSYPDYITRLIEPNDCIKCEIFPDKFAQAKAVAKQIKIDLSEGELEMRDILIVLPEAYTAKQEAVTILKELNELGIPGHLAGVTSSLDELFNDDAIAISSIYRAKGNEAPMVYILNSDYAFEGTELTRRRNIIFTAITRSKAWVRLFGCGSGMKGLKLEIEQVKKNDYNLTFKVPTEPELERMRKLYRDMTPQEREKYQKFEENLSYFVEQIQKGNMSAENLPRELRSKLLDLLKNIENDE